MDFSGMNQFDGNGKPSKKGGRKGNGKKGKGRTSLMRLSHCKLFRFNKGRKSPSHGNQNKVGVKSHSHGNQNKGVVELPYPRVPTYEDKYLMWQSMLLHNHDLCIASRKKKPIYSLYYMEGFSGSETEEEGLEHLYNLSD